MNAQTGRGGGLELGDVGSETWSVAQVSALVPAADQLHAKGWRETWGPLAGQVAYLQRAERLSLLLSAGLQDDGHLWLHASLAHRDRLPTWDELVRAKELFLGADVVAIQVLPPRTKWVNIHPYCLHLWVCLDASPLPDFTQGTGSI